MSQWSSDWASSEEIDPAVEQQEIRTLLGRFEEAGDNTGYHAMQELLAQRERPDAVFCYNDLSAIGAIKAALQAGLRRLEPRLIVRRSSVA